jgi:hypothetical protein
MNWKINDVKIYKYIEVFIAILRFVSKEKEKEGKKFYSSEEFL